jgi:O-antigen/teichoic acid export membrane protein
MGILKKIINRHTLSLASNAVMPVMGMISVSLLARYLSNADFGYWTFFLITYTLANFFRSGFLQTSLVKFYSGASKERALTVSGSTWILGFAITLLLGILCFFAYLFYHGHTSTEIIIKWFSIIFFSSLPSSIALWILQAEGRFDRMFVLQLIGQGCFFISIIILIVTQQTHFQIVIYAYCASAVVTSLFTIVTGWAYLTSITYKSWTCVKELANFGKYSVGASISSYLLRGSDTFIIKYMFTDPSVVGIYYLPQRLMEIIEIPLRSFIATALPPMATSMQRGNTEYMTYVMKKYAGILTILLIPVSIVAFIGADLIIDLIGGQNFAHTQAANVFRIFMCFAILLPIDRFFGITLDILNKPKNNMIKVFLMLIVNVAGDFLGIYIFHNIYGVAISSIFTFLIGIIYGYWVLKRHLSFTLTDVLKVGFIETKDIIISFINRFKRKETVTKD